MPQLDPVLQTLIAEAYGEGPEGMRLAAETIVNRAEQRGLTPVEVVQQRRQYSGYENPGPAVRPLFNDPNAISAAQAAWDLARGPGDPTGGANHYFAPGTISTPSWARSMTPTLTHGGHAFYTDRPGYQQRGLGPVAVNPAQITPTTAALRQMTSPSRGNTELQTALNQYATRERNRVTPQTPAWLMTGMNQEPAASSASNSLQNATRRAALSMGSNQTYAGQSRAPSGGPATRSVQSVPVAGSRIVTAAPANAIQNAALMYRNGGPTRPGMNPQPLPPNRQSGNPVNQNGVPVARPPTGWPVGWTQSPSMPVEDMYRGTGVLPLTNGSNRLSPSPATQSAGLASLRSQNPMTLIPPNPRVAIAPVPFQRPTGVGTQLSVTPPRVAPVPFQRPASFASIPNVGPQTPRVAPVPLQRPNFGMGGPGFAPVNAAAMASSPAPAPLNIMVQGARTIQPPPMQMIAPSVVQQLRTQGLTPAQAYAAANRGGGGTSWAAQDRTRDSGGNSGLSSI